MSALEHEYVTPETRCPQCNHRFDRASAVHSDGAPTEGDVSMCIECATALVFNADLTLRAMTADELSDLQPGIRSELVRLQKAIGAIHQRTYATSHSTERQSVKNRR